MSFIGSGKEALRLLASERFDVIVSDMRMPEMDGATLLKKVQDEYPEVVRIVLSGHAELEAALRAVPVAHQFLTKPCEAGLLENVVERACSLQALVNDEVVRRTVGRIEKLPSLPRVYSQLMGVLADEQSTTRDAAEIIKQDVAMCAKILQLVNSAFFRRSREISKIEEAVTYLGTNMVKQVVLAVEVFSKGTACGNLAGLSIEALQHHSLLVAGIASSMFTQKPEKEDAFIAGLLHDIGKLLLAMELPEHVQRVVDTMRREGGAMHLVEERLLGVTHAEVGAYLLGIWGLPYPIVEAVANHHAPGRVEQPAFDLVAAVHVADALACEQANPVVSGAERQNIDLDPSYLDKLGIGEQIGAWRETAKERAGAHQSGTVA
jgi:putative nucleotidyltransferase with HDIG domain